MNGTIKSGDTLVVIFRDDSPMLFCDDSSSYRSVRVRLTAEQQQEILRRRVGAYNGEPIYESISKCFIQEGAKP